MAHLLPEAGVQLRRTGPQNKRWFLQVRWAKIVLLVLGGMPASAASTAPTVRFLEGLLLAAVVAAITPCSNCSCATEGRRQMVGEGTRCLDRRTADCP
jgi:hypothetical protein